MLKIGQVAEMLNMSSDSLKFYEDKKLLFPKRNEDNGYREYSVLDILDILTINFYRNIDFEIKKIQDIRKSKSIDGLYDLLKQQQQKIEDEIRLKQNILDKIANTITHCNIIKENLGALSIREFEPVVALSDASNIIKFDKEQTNADTESVFSWNNLMRMGRFNSAGILDDKILVVRAAQANDKKEEIIAFPKCIYTVTEAGGNDDMDAEIGEQIMKAAIKMKAELLGTFMVRNLIVTYEDRIDKIYSEIYVPIK